MGDETWIESCTRLPEESGDYLCVAKDSNGDNYVSIFFFSYFGKTWSDKIVETLWKSKDQYKVMYWRSLPEIPKESK